MHAASGGSGRRILLRQQREGSQTKGCETSLRPQSRHQERGAPARAEKTLVPKRSKMANRMRGPDQRTQTPPRTDSQPLQRRGRNEALGRTWSDRRQPHQHRTTQELTTWLTFTAPDFQTRFLLKT